MFCRNYKKHVVFQQFEAVLPKRSFSEHCFFIFEHYSGFEFVFGAVAECLFMWIIGAQDLRFFLEHYSCFEFVFGAVLQKRLVLEQCSKNCRFSSSAPKTDVFGALRLRVFCGHEDNQ